VAAPTLYRASNVLDPRVWFIVPVVGGGAAALIAVVYAFIGCLITQVFEQGSLFIIVTPMFGAALAYAGQGVANLAHVRPRGQRRVVAVIVALMGLYAAWQAYIVLLDAQFVPPVSWTMSPMRLLHAMHQLAAEHPIQSYFCWLLEAATVIGMVVYLMKSVDLETPFCETCKQWSREVASFEIPSEQINAAISKLEAGDAAAVVGMRGKDKDRDSYGVVRVYRCPCGESRHASVFRATVSRGRKGGVKYSPILIGGRPKLHYDLGSSDMTDLVPQLENMAIDEATEKQLES
jgi:hypothetical protein